MLKFHELSMKQTQWIRKKNIWCIFKLKKSLLVCLHHNHKMVCLTFLGTNCQNEEMCSCMGLKVFLGWVCEWYGHFSTSPNVGGKTRQAGCRSPLFSQLKQFMQIMCLFGLFLEHHLEMHHMKSLSPNQGKIQTKQNYLGLKNTICLEIVPE